MSTPYPIHRELVIEHSAQMPSFPKVVTDIIRTVDDPDGSINVLVECINHDPLIAGRVLAAANLASARMRRDREVTDSRTATALIGMSRVRDIALISSLGGFVKTLSRDQAYTKLWNHGVAVGITAQELALHVDADISTDAALIAGLLHDIGQLWLYTYLPEVYADCRERARVEVLEIEDLEVEMFGVSHSTIGSWLAEEWGLPTEICLSIAMHHHPETALDHPLVCLLHVAEVLSNALDLTQSPDSRVTRISGLACQRLGITWDKPMRHIFGRIEARSMHANRFFQAEATTSSPAR